jgi:acyl-CoA synthetase (AMP-forming)/AMP-acid ligase II
VTGRLKHLIDVGGLKVNPLEVEEVFSGHPAVRECAVVGVPLSETVVRLRLLYVPANGTLPGVGEFRAFARERLSPHKLPRVFEAVASLPRSPTGKLLRERLELL